MKNKTLSNRFWLFLLGGVLLISLAVSAYFFLREGSGSEAVIVLDGQEIQRIDLSKVKEPYTFPLTGVSGLTNTVEVAPGKVRIQSANCPDQTCVHQGWIESSAGLLVCLPNSLVIGVSEGDGSALIDGVVG